MASLAGRRLAELLQEQQEPFLLDAYLLENGYSRRILCSEATATCWPRGTACRRLQRLASHGFQGRGERILGSLLGVFARRRPPQTSNNWGMGGVEDGGSPCGMARSTREDGIGGDQLGKIKVDAERAHGWESTEEAKQLSPVSVLELQSDDTSPAHEHGTSLSLSSLQFSLILHLILISSCPALVALRTAKEEEPSTSGLYAQVGAVEVFGGLHGSASSHYNMGTHEKRQAPLEEWSTHLSEQRDQHLHGSVDFHRRGKARRRQLRRRAGEAIAAIHLTESDVSMKWNQFNSHVMEIGTEVGRALLDELVEDLVSHLYD